MKIGRGVSELWRVENLPLPLTWPMARTTACTTVINEKLMIFCLAYLYVHHLIFLPMVCYEYKTYEYIWKLANYPLSVKSEGTSKEK